MAVAKPIARPNITREEVARIIEHRKNKSKVVVLLIRGYYLDSMGKKGKNDRGVYDDAVVVVDTKGNADPKTWKIATFNGNTDPSKYRDKTEERKGMACLPPGTYWWMKGQHGISRGNPYDAFVQAQEFTIKRDGSGDKEFRGWFGINIHKGSLNSTSSEGCQTIHPTQWDEFYKCLTGAMSRSKVTRFPGEVMEEVDRRKYVEHIPE